MFRMFQNIVIISDVPHATFRVCCLSMTECLFKSSLVHAFPYWKWMQANRKLRLEQKTRFACDTYVTSVRRCTDFKDGGSPLCEISADNLFCNVRDTAV